MKIFLFGKNGQLGRALYPELSKMGEVIAFSRAEANFECPDKIIDIIRSERPDIVVNTVAYTNVDDAENDKDRAFRINAHAVKLIADAVNESDAWLIHYSTDYVFDGNKELPYQELDAPQPINVYGASKWAGDRAVIEAAGKYIIIRTSWLYGLNGKNFPNTILSLARERKVLKIVNDQFGAPTNVDLVARMTGHIIQSLTNSSDLLAGVYHLSAKGKISWHDYAHFLIDEAVRQGLSSITEDIIAINSMAYGAAAKRPYNSCLECRKLEDTFDVTLPDWKEDVISYIKNYVVSKVQNDH